MERKESVERPDEEADPPIERAQRFAADAGDRAGGDAGEQPAKEAAGSPAEKPAKQERQNPMVKLLAWAGPAKALYALSVVLAIVGVAGNIVPYFAAGNMMAGVLDGTRDFAFYQYWCAVAAVGYLVHIVCHHASTTISHKATFATISRMRTAVAEKLARVPLGYVLDTPTGKLKNVLVERLDAIEVPLAHVVPEMTSNLVVSIAVVVYLFTLNWILALVSLIVVPIGMFAYMQMMTDYDTWYGNTIKTGNDMSAASIEYVGGIEVIKAFGRSASSYRKFSDAVFAYAHSFIDWMAHCQIWQDLGLAIAPASLVTVLPVGCGMVMAGWIEPSTFILMAVLSLSIFPPIYAAIRFIDSIAQVGLVVGEISDVLGQPEQRRAPQAVPAGVAERASAADRGVLAGGSAAFADGAADAETLVANAAGAPAVELDHVGFSYEEPASPASAAGASTGDAGADPSLPVALARSRRAASDVSLTVPQGSVVALVGPSGAGKSTIARLVAGFWDAEEGQVRLFGKPIESLTSPQINALVSYVSQDNFLFDDTIMDNIRVGRPQASDAEVIACAKAAGCHEFVAKLEHGYQTVVGTAGGHLSGGERQRIAIARAMMKDAPIVILDEATAYMDPESEAEVERAVSRLVAGKTLIVIAHRLSTVVDADRIFVVDGGAVAAAGTHKQLMDGCALYRSMFEAHMGAKDQVA